MKKLVLLLLSASMIVGCQSAYYAAAEKVGYAKRDILVDRVEGAMEAQEDAKEEFQSAFQRFSSVVAVPPSELQDTYESLDAAYRAAEADAKRVTERIDADKDLTGIGYILISMYRQVIVTY